MGRSSRSSRSLDEDGVSSSSRPPKSEKKRKKVRVKEVDSVVSAISQSSTVSQVDLSACDFDIDLNAINATDETGRTALYKASMGGHLEVVKFLLDRRANVNATDSNRTSILLAMCKGGMGSMHISVMKTLCERGADVNLSDKNREVPLYVAAMEGNVEAVAVLLSAGALVNTKCTGKTALNVASRWNHLPVVKLLLVQPGVETNLCGSDKRTALFEACRYGHLEIVRELVSAYANVNAVDSRKCSCLSMASHFGYFEVVKCLVESGGAVIRQADYDEVRTHPAANAAIVAYLHEKNPALL